MTSSPRFAFVTTTLLFVTACTASAQDREFVRAYERAQTAKPARVTSTARIAPASEPGDALVINGRVY